MIFMTLRRGLSGRSVLGGWEMNMTHSWGDFPGGLRLKEFSIHSIRKGSHNENSSDK